MRVGARRQPAKDGEVRRRVLWPQACRQHQSALRGGRGQGPHPAWLDMSHAHAGHRPSRQHGRQPLGDNPQTICIEEQRVVVARHCDDLKRQRRIALPFSRGQVLDAQPVVFLRRQWLGSAEDDDRAGKNTGGLVGGQRPLVVPPQLSEVAEEHTRGRPVVLDQAAEYGRGDLRAPD